MESTKILFSTFHRESKSEMKIFLFTFITIVYLAVGQNECQPTTCGPFAPVVRFPFWLKGQQPEHCGYPGFGLSCNESGRTELDLQFPVTASANNILLPLNMTVAVWDIDYKAQKMLAGYPRARSCLPEKLPTVNSPASLFQVEGIGYNEGSILFNCSNTREYEAVACLSSRRYQVITFASMYDITSLPPYSSCFKMYNISYVPDGALTGGDNEYGSRFYLSWGRPSCGKCEVEGEYCRLQNATAAQETECFGLQHSTGTGAQKNHIIIAGITAGIILLALIMMASFFIFRLMKKKKDDHRRIENALKSHKDMRPRRYSYVDVKRYTNNFKEKLGQGSYAMHKGMLTNGTPVAVKVLDGSEQNVEDFIGEVERIGRMQHENTLQLIGYCVDRHRRALIYEFLQGGTLDVLISSEIQNHTLGWEKLQKIALGIAKGVEYVHQESTQEILKLVSSPQSILLDHNLNPKVLVATTSAAEGTLEYTAPELFSSSFNITPQKAYCYGFGMLLLDMVGRRVNFHRGEKESSEVHFPEWVYSQLEKRKEGAIQIEEEGIENEIAKRFSIVGLWCIQWFPSDRPSMKAVIEMLEQENMPRIPPNPFASFDLHVKR